MKFEPLNVQANTTNDFTPRLLPEGIYQVRVEDANEGFSKAGNAQIKLKVQVKGPEFNVFVWDYLGATSKKLRNFCQNMNLEDKYMNGEIVEDDCIYKVGYAKIVKENSEKYGEQNKLAFYVPAPSDKKSTQVKTQKSVDEAVVDAFKDDSIPF